MPACPLYIVYRAMSIGRKIFWFQIILANCHQIKIRKDHHSGILAKRL
nr:MAG TPA: hypothetical protein [Caudoviricetes sp.]